MGSKTAHSIENLLKSQKIGNFDKNTDLTNFTFCQKKLILAKNKKQKLADKNSSIASGRTDSDGTDSEGENFAEKKFFDTNFCQKFLENKFTYSNFTEKMEKITAHFEQISANKERVIFFSIS